MMARGHLIAATLLLVGGLAGCVEPDGTGPGPDNPQLALYQTADNMTQVVVKGAFKTLQFDRVAVTSGNATLVSDEHVFVAATKVNASVFNLTVHVDLDGDVYTYNAAFSVLATGLQVVEVEDGVAGDPNEVGFPFTRILEKEKEARD